MKEPLVSVIIPAYDRAKFVTKAIDSVLAQTYSDYEIIVVDDGSTDNTRQILEPYMKKINYIYKENAGVSAARNTGIRMARNEWIAFLDSDDIWLPDKLSVQMEYVNHTKAKVCFTDVEYVSNGLKPMIKKNKYTKRLFHEPFDLILWNSFVLYVQTMLIERDLVERLRGFDERLKVAEDTKIIYDLAFETPFAYIDSPLVFINRSIQRDGLINNSPEAIRTACEAHTEIISQAYIRCYKKKDSIIKRLRHMLGHFLSTRAAIYCAERNYSDARRSAKDALCLGGKLRTYRRSIGILLFPWLVGLLRRRKY